MDLYWIFAILIVAIVSSIVTRRVMPEILKNLEKEGFENGSGSGLSIPDILKSVSMETIRTKKDTWGVAPEMLRTLSIKGLRNGVVIAGGDKETSLTVKNLDRTVGGLRVSSGGDCSDHTHWALQFFINDQLGFLCYPEGDMPAREDRAGLIHPWHVLRAYTDGTQIVKDPW
jgi:hypothetical protein